MSGPTSVNITSTNSLFDAFKTLTVDREKYRGTLTVSKGADGQVELKCVNHKFVGGKVNVKANEAALVRSKLRDAVEELLTRSTNRMIADDYDHFAAVNAKLTTLMDMLDANMGISGRKALGRAEIGKIITQVENLSEGLKKMDANKFLDADVDTLYDFAVGKLTFEEIAQAKNDRRASGVEDAKKLLGDCAAHAFADAKGEKIRDGFVAAFGGGDTTVNLNPKDEELKTIPESVKKMMGQGADKLRAKLQKLADLYMESGPEKDRIINLIVKDEKKVASQGGVDVLSCADIADAVKTIAKAAKSLGYDILAENIDEEKLAVAGNALKLDTKKALGKALMAEKSRPEVLAKEVNSGSNHDIGINFVKMMADDQLRAEAAKKARDRLNGEKPFVVCSDMEVGENHPVKNISEQFHIALADSTAAAKQCEAQGKKTAVQIFADGHFCACGLPNGWTTQEEAVLGADPEAMDVIALLYEEGKIEATLDKTGNLRFEYNDLFTTGGGYVINTGKKLYAFFSMPSFSGDSWGIDVKGDVEWFCHDQKLSGHELNAEEKGNVYKFIDKLTDLKINHALDCSEKEYNQVIEYLLFGRDPDFDISKPIPDDQLEETVKNFAKSISKFGKEKFEDVEKNYISTIGHGYALMAKVLDSMGAEALVIGKAGVGTFKNPILWAASAMKQMSETAGGMDFVYADRDGLNSKTGEVSNDAKTYQKVIVGDAGNK